VIVFIEARAIDIDEPHRFEQWHRDAILEAFEIGPEARVKKSG
jgi:hypothetical protein